MYRFSIGTGFRSHALYATNTPSDDVKFAVYQENAKIYTSKIRKVCKGNQNSDQTDNHNIYHINTIQLHACQPMAPFITAIIT
jgi:hypothetical protein